MECICSPITTFKGNLVRCAWWNGWKSLENSLSSSGKIRWAKSCSYKEGLKFIIMPTMAPYLRSWIYSLSLFIASIYVHWQQSSWEEFSQITLWFPGLHTGYSFAFVIWNQNDANLRQIGTCKINATCTIWGHWEGSFKKEKECTKSNWRIKKKI